MSEKELNEQYIKNKIQGICQDCMWFDKTIPIINKMLSEAYISGFEQGKFDNKMDLQQKVEQLEKENIKQKEIIENLTTMTVCGDKKQIKNTAQCKLEQLENIRKEAIEYIEKCGGMELVNDYSFPEKTIIDKEAKTNLLNILNKGDNNVKDKR